MTKPHAATINMTVDLLWRAYAGTAQSGRFPCPVIITSPHGETEVTHIYRGYGATRLERISGEPAPRKKGFQGEDVTPRDRTFQVRD